jgi:GntR family transcriptional regulator
MIVQIDPSSATPPYEQLRIQIETLAATGQLRVGDQLPTIRQLAGDLGLAAGTVARAYRELETVGVVVSRRRHGTFVVEPGRRAKQMSQSERTRRVTDAAQAFALVARQVGLEPDLALAAAAAALRFGEQ